MIEPVSSPKESAGTGTWSLGPVDPIIRLSARLVIWGASHLAEALDPERTRPNALLSAAPKTDQALIAHRPQAESVQIALQYTAEQESLREKMQRLQRRAIEQSTTGGEVELFHRILDQIVPDEARIVGALSDGSASALVHVRGRGGTGTLENASLIARTANLALPRMGPTYIGNLLSLGLLEIGPEDEALKEDYQILMAETWVLKVIKAAGKGPLPARIEKGTIRLSALGHSLWAATMSTGT